MGMSQGVWRVKLPTALDGVAGPLDVQFPTRDAVFSASRCANSQQLSGTRHRSRVPSGACTWIGQWRWGDSSKAVSNML